MSHEPASESAARIDFSPNDDYIAEDKSGKSGFVVPETAGWEWLIIAIMCLSCVAYWATHHNNFYRPHPDYHSFEKTAREIWSGQMPSNYKRMPLYPAIFGGVAQLLNAENPYLESALILNMIFSAGVLALLFLFLRGLIGRVAIVPVAFMALGMLFLDQALLPIIEPFMLCMILLTLWLFRRGSRWQYVAAFFAALSRYEASALIFILFLLNSFDLRGNHFGSFSRDNYSVLVKLEWGSSRRVLKHLLFAALASVGFLAWMGLSFYSSRYGNPHLKLMSEMGWPTNPEFITLSAAKPFHVWAVKAAEGGYMAALFGLFIALPALLGVLVSFKRFGRVSLAILIFTGLYILAQVIYGIGHERYVYTVFWVAPVYFAVGWATILHWLDRKLFRRYGRGSKLLLVVGVIIALISCAALYDSFSKVRKSDGTALRPLYIQISGDAEGEAEAIPTPDSADLSANEVYPIFWVFMTGAILAFGLLWGRAKGGRGLIVGFLLAAMLGYSGAAGIRRHADMAWRRYYRFYQFYIAGRYLDGLLAPGETAAVEDKGTILDTTSLPKDAVFEFEDLDSDSLDQLPDELERRNIGYVVYTWRRIHDREDRPESWLIQEGRKYHIMWELRQSEGELEDFELIEVLPWPKRQIGEGPRIYRFKR